MQHNTATQYPPPPLPPAYLGSMCRVWGRVAGECGCCKAACHVFKRDRSDLSDVRAASGASARGLPLRLHFPFVLLSLCLTSCFVTSSACSCLHACCCGTASVWGNRFGLFWCFVAVQFDFVRRTSSVSFWQCNQVGVCTCHLVLSVYSLTVQKIRSALSFPLFLSLALSSVVYLIKSDPIFILEDSAAVAICLWLPSIPNCRFKNSLVLSCFSSLFIF